MLLPVCLDAFLQLLRKLQQPCVHGSEAGEHVLTSEGLAAADGVGQLAWLDLFAVLALREAVQPSSVLHTQRRLQAGKRNSNLCVQIRHTVGRQQKWRPVNSRSGAVTYQHASTCTPPLMYCCRLPAHVLATRAKT